MTTIIRTGKIEPVFTFFDEKVIFWLNSYLDSHHLQRVWNLPHKFYLYLIYKIKFSYFFVVRVLGKDGSETLLKLNTAQSHNFPLLSIKLILLSRFIFGYLQLMHLPIFSTEVVDFHRILNFLIRRPLKAPPTNPRTYALSVLKSNFRFKNAIFGTILKKPRFATLGSYNMFKNKLNGHRPEDCFILELFRTYFRTY